MTPFIKKCNILGEFFEGFKGGDKYLDLFEMNDLGLPLAFAIDAKIVKSSAKAQTIVNQTWDDFCDELDLDSDGDYENLSQMFSLSDEN